MKKASQSKPQIVDQDNAWKDLLDRHLKFLDWLIQLPTELEEKLTREIEKSKGVKRMPYVTSWERIAQQRGEKIGEERGEERGEKKMLFFMLRRKVGELSDVLTAQIERLPIPQLEQLADALPDFTQASDLERWLQRYAAQPEANGSPAQ